MGHSSLQLFGSLALRHEILQPEQLQILIDVQDAVASAFKGFALADVVTAIEAQRGQRAPARSLAAARRRHTERPASRRRQRPGTAPRPADE